MSHNLSLLLAGFNGIAYFLSSLIPIWIIDRLGRRKLMLFAASGQCVCMAILAGTVSNGSHAAGIVAIVMLFLFNFFFAVGLLAIPWLRKFLFFLFAINHRHKLTYKSPPSMPRCLSAPVPRLWPPRRTGSSLSSSSKSRRSLSAVLAGRHTFTFPYLTLPSCLSSTSPIRRRAFCHSSRLTSCSLAQRSCFTGTTAWALLARSLSSAKERMVTLRRVPLSTAKRASPVTRSIATNCRSIII